MMYPRLKLARNLLHNGVIFISIGEEEKSNLTRYVVIFGNIILEIHLLSEDMIKISTSICKNGLKTLNVAYEYILSYSKSNEFLFNAVYKEADKSKSLQAIGKDFGIMQIGQQ